MNRTHSSQLVPLNLTDSTAPAVELTKKKKGDKVKEIKTCPKCSGYIPNNETPGAYPGAISRRDNLTEICSACGTEEALEDFFGTAVK
jgi:RNA polymerase subunit RPABC4/transcription elongation factor Spt4